MKQRIILGIGTLLTLVILSKSGIFGALMVFLLVGAVPGTTISLPAWLMLTICLVSLLLLTFRYTLVSLVDAVGLHRLTRKYLVYRERMPKRRFQSIL